MILTDNEMDLLTGKLDIDSLARAIEAAVLAKLSQGVEMPEAVANVSASSNGRIGFVKPDKNYYTADQLRIERAAARVKALDECEKLCEAIADKYYSSEGMKYPELKTDAQTGASDCESAIRALKGTTP